MIEIKKEKKLWNKCQTWDKTKAYKSSKLGEKELMFEKTFFLLFFFLCQNHFQVTINWNHFFLSFSLCQSLLRLQLHIQRNFRWSQGGRCPLAPLWFRHWSLMLFLLCINHNISHLIILKNIVYLNFWYFLKGEAGFEIPLPASYNNWIT